MDSRMSHKYTSPETHIHEEEYILFYKLNSSGLCLASAVGRKAG
jgi:hypothetical protein